MVGTDHWAVHSSKYLFSAKGALSLLAPSVLICGRLFLFSTRSKNNFAVAYRNTADVVVVPVISDIVS
jgi:hypothetical protein